MKLVVCFSGGHSSAIAAIETVRKYGKNNVILLNHNINQNVEHQDIKRFKEQVANFLGLEITYANMKDWYKYDPLDVCINIKAFKIGNGTALCTNRLKVAPFNDWLKINYPSNPFKLRDDVTIIYGFDGNEQWRIQRRIGILQAMGYKSDYPVALWDRTIENIEEIGIIRPSTYKTFRHANCIGCLKAGKQQWYIVYCLRPDIWEKAKYAEDVIGYSILRHEYLDELEVKFASMKYKGIIPTEKFPYQTFWSKVKKELEDDDNIPCECFI